MSNGNTSYITKNGDTWTGIAFKAYGDVNKVNLITEVNPYCSLIPVLPDGINILIPIIDRPSIDVTNLPPWKR